MNYEIWERLVQFGWYMDFPVVKDYNEQVHDGKNKGRYQGFLPVGVCILYRLFYLTFSNIFLCATNPGCGDKAMTSASGGRKVVSSSVANLKLSLESNVNLRRG